ncbi:MAG: hemolysin family protein [Chlamydiota bacterium]
MLIFSIILLLLLLGFSAFLSCSETALFSLPSFTIRKYRHSSKYQKQLVATLLHHPTDLLVTIMMLNVCANILIQNVVSSLFGQVSSAWFKIGVPLFLTLFLGEILPKSLAIAQNERFALFVSPYIAFARWFFSPIRRILTWITSFLSRVFFFFFEREKAMSPKELEHILHQSKNKGVMQQQEVDLIKGFLDLQNSTVKEHLRPREDILFYDVQEPVERLLDLMVQEQCSRLPVCDGGLDCVMGIISVRRFFFYTKQIKTAHDVKTVLKKPFYVPESSSASSLLEEMRARQESFALAVDEYGFVTGLVTQEDLIESVIGEIIDRRDHKDRKYRRSGKDVIIASGKLELLDFEGIFGERLLSGDAVTLGGWLIEQMGDIPKTGDKYVTDQFLFSVVSAEPNRVRQVYVRKRTVGQREK